MANGKKLIPNFNTFADIVDRLAVTVNKLAFFENEKRQESMKPDKDTRLIAYYDILSRNECEYRNLLKRALDDLLSEIVETKSYVTLPDYRTFSPPGKSVADLVEEVCSEAPARAKTELQAVLAKAFNNGN